MAGGRRIPVTVEADTDGNFDKAARGLDDVGREADGADAALRRMSKGHQALTTEIEKTRTSAKSLREEFQRTGDVSLLGDADKLDRNLKRLETQFTKVFGDSGKSLTQSVQGSFQEIATSVPKLGAPLAVGLTAAISPAIAAGISAGVALGFAGGALAGGIALAAKDARVSSAWGGIFTDAGDQLSRRSSVLVQPLVDAAGEVGRSFDRVIPKIGDSFDKLAPRIQQLGAGAGQLVENIFKGNNFDRVISLGDRLLGRLAAELPNFGNAINNFLGSIADAAPGAEQFWSEFLVGTQRTIVGIGNVVEALSKTYKAMDDFGNGINDGFDKASVAVDNFLTTTTEKANKFSFAHAFGWDKDSGDEPVRKLNMLNEQTKQVGDTALQAAINYSQLTQSVNATAATAETTYAAAVDRILNTTMGLDQATLGFAESQTRLGESIKNNSTNYEMNTAKGQANREAILGVVQANQGQFDAMIRAGAGADQARAAYDANTRALEDQLHKAGFTQRAIDDLIGKYRSVPDDVSTAIQLQGLQSAISGLADVIRHVNGIPTSREIYITTHINSVITGGQSPDRVMELAPKRHGGIVAAAHGMIVDSPTVLFGERGTGHETYVPWKGISSQRAYDLMAPTAANFGMNLVDPRRGGSGLANPVAAGGGSGPVTVNLTMGFSGGGLPLESALADWFHSSLRMGRIWLKTEQTGERVRVG